MRYIDQWIIGSLVLLVICGGNTCSKPWFETQHSAIHCIETLSPQKETPYDNILKCPPPQWASSAQSICTIHYSILTHISPSHASVSAASALSKIRSTQQDRIATCRTWKCRSRASVERHSPPAVDILLLSLVSFSSLCVCVPGPGLLVCFVAPVGYMNRFHGIPRSLADIVKQPNISSAGKGLFYDFNSLAIGKNSSQKVCQRVHRVMPLTSDIPQFTKSTSVRKLKSSDFNIDSSLRKLSSHSCVLLSCMGYIDDFLCCSLFQMSPRRWRTLSLSTMPCRCPSLALSWPADTGEILLLLLLLGMRQLVDTELITIICYRRFDWSLPLISTRWNIESSTNKCQRCYSSSITNRRFGTNYHYAIGTHWNSILI